MVTEVVFRHSYQTKVEQTSLYFAQANDKIITTNAIEIE